MKNPFRKGFEISMNRVKDTVVIREGNERLTLNVNADAQRLFAGLNAAYERMKNINESTEESEVKDIAKYFSGVIFGTDQAQKLSEFYANDAAAIISVCGRYFRDRLAGLIADVQKRMKV
jgi:hypothetical protein